MQSPPPVDRPCFRTWTLTAIVRRRDGTGWPSVSAFCNVRRKIGSNRIRQSSVQKSICIRYSSSRFELWRYPGTSRIHFDGTEGLQTRADGRKRVCLVRQTSPISATSQADETTRPCKILNCSSNSPNDTNAGAGGQLIGTNPSFLCPPCIYPSSPIFTPIWVGWPSLPVLSPSGIVPWQVTPRSGR